MNNKYVPKEFISFGVSTTTTALSPTSVKSITEIIGKFSFHLVWVCLSVVFVCLLMLAILLLLIRCIIKSQSKRIDESFNRFGNELRQNKKFDNPYSPSKSAPRSSTEKELESPSPLILKTKSVSSITETAKSSKSKITNNKFSSNCLIFLESNDLNGLAKHLNEDHQVELDSMA